MLVKGATGVKAGISRENLVNPMTADPLALRPQDMDSHGFKYTIQINSSHPQERISITNIISVLINYVECK